MKDTYFGFIMKPVHETNDIDALNPEVWAREALLALHSNTVMLPLVNTQFKNEIADYGDTVNAHRPPSYEAQRTGLNDTVTIQDTEVENVPVVLNQKWNVTFSIKDGDLALSFKDLMALQMAPALEAISQALDSVLFTQMYQFLGNTRSVGKLDTALTEATINNLVVAMDNNKVPPAGRNMVLSPSAYGSIRSIDKFTSAEQVDDQGRTIKSGKLGEIYGLTAAMTQNAPTIVGSALDKSTTYVLDGAHDAGDTSLTVATDPASATLTGRWCTVAGDMQPQLITSVATDTINIFPGLKYSALTGAQVTIYTPAAINYPTDYAAGYAGALTIEGLSAGEPPQHNQLISIGETAAAKIYGAVNTSTITSVLTDRPLDAIVEDEDVLGIGPAGSYGFGFHRNAFTLVSRPMPLPPAKFVDSAVINYNGIGLRATVSYDNLNSKTVVKLDFLCGVKVLNTSLGFPIYS